MAYRAGDKCSKGFLFERPISAVCLFAAILARRGDADMLGKVALVTYTIYGNLRAGEETAK
jgi:hypothetical protein